MLRILATAYDFRPRVGGIATLGYELLRALSRFDGVKVRVLAPNMPGAREFDRESGLDTRRLHAALKAAPDVAPFTLGIAREAALFRPHAVLNLLWMPDGLAAFSAAPILKSLGVPYYVYAHGKELIESRATIRKRVRKAVSPLKRAVFNGAAGAFVVSRFTRDLVLANCGTEAARVHITHPGIDPARFIPGPKPEALLERYGLRGKKIFLTVTRLEDYKGVDRVIAAMALLRDRHPEAAYVVCGTGPDRSRLEAIARHYRVADRVVFAGAVPHGELVDHYNLADVYIMLSRTDWDSPDVEGFGIVFIEAAGCAKPSIGGNSGGIVDAVGGEETGWLVDSENPADAARAMSEALDNPELVLRKGQKARARALEDFTWDRMAAGVLRVVREGGKPIVRD